MLNLAVPGAGLIVLRREWLGSALALLFCLFAQIAVAGFLLLPDVIPGPTVAAAAVSALLIWFGAQWLLAKRIRWFAGESLERELDLLRARSAEAAESGDLLAALDLLRAALTLNDEDVLLNRKWAELASLAGRHADADRAWRRVIQLERDRDARRAARR